jgi:signal transduction histidine kinase
VALVVEDTGPGIASEEREKIFTPYFTTKHESGGTGLGLAIAHRIVSDHGGRIAVTDSTLGGARFVIELPIPGSGGELGASLRG